MVEIIVACMASIADIHCPSLIDAGGGMRTCCGAPIEVCLQNDSDQVGSFAFDKMTKDGAVIRVSPNIHLCETPTS